MLVLVSRRKHVISVPICNIHVRMRGRGSSEIRLQSCIFVIIGLMWRPSDSQSVRTAEFGHAWGSNAWIRQGAAKKEAGGDQAAVSESAEVSGQAASAADPLPPPPSTDWKQVLGDGRKLRRPRTATPFVTQSPKPTGRDQAPVSASGEGSGQAASAAPVSDSAEGSGQIARADWKHLPGDDRTSRRSGSAVPLVAPSPRLVDAQEMPTVKEQAPSFGPRVCMQTAALAGHQRNIACTVDNIPCIEALRTLPEWM